MRQIFWTIKMTQVLGNVDSRVQESMHRAFDKLETPFSFVFAGAYIPLIVRSGGRKKKAGWISAALETPSPNEVLISLYAVHFVIILQTKKTLTVPVHFRKISIVVLLVQRV